MPCSAMTSWKPAPAICAQAARAVAHVLERRRRAGRILEIISPAGFERFFAELVAMGGVAETDEQALTELCARYELEMRPETVPGLVERFGLRFPATRLREPSEGREPAQSAGVSFSIAVVAAQLPRSRARARTRSRGPRSRS